MQFDQPKKNNSFFQQKYAIRKKRCLGTIFLYKSSELRYQSLNWALHKCKDTYSIVRKASFGAKILRDEFAHGSAINLIYFSANIYAYKTNRMALKTSSAALFCSSYWKVESVIKQTLATNFSDSKAWKYYSNKKRKRLNSLILKFFPLVVADFFKEEEKKLSLLPRSEFFISSLGPKRWSVP